MARRPYPGVRSLVRGDGAKMAPRHGGHWRSDMGVEPTQDRITAPQTVLKFEVSLRRLPHPTDANLRNPCKSGKSSSSALH